MKWQLQRQLFVPEGGRVKKQEDEVGRGRRRFLWGLKFKVFPCCSGKRTDGEREKICLKGWKNGTCGNLFFLSFLLLHKVSKMTNSP